MRSNVTDSFFCVAVVAPDKRGETESGRNVLTRNRGLTDFYKNCIEGNRVNVNHKPETGKWIFGVTGTFG